MKQVAVLGIDGLGPDKYGQMLIEGLKCAAGSTVVLRLVESIPPYTAPAWTSIASGVNPGKHGIADFMEWRSLRINTAWDVKFPRLWEVLGLVGMRSLVYNVPLTYPLEAMYLKGSIVLPGWDAPIKYQVKALAEFRRELRTRLKPLQAPEPKLLKKVGAEEFLEKALDTAQFNAGALLEAVERCNPNLFFGVFSEYDWLLHLSRFVSTKFLKTAIRRLTNLYSKFLRRLTDAFDLVLVVSDHGFQDYVAELDLMAALCSLTRSCLCGLSVRDSKVKALTYIAEELLNLTALKRAYLTSATLRKYVTRASKVARTTIARECVRGAHNVLLQGLFLGGACKRHLNVIKGLLERLGFEVTEGGKIFWGPYVNLMPDLVFTVKSFQLKLLVKIHSEERRKSSLISEGPIADHSPWAVMMVKASGSALEGSASTRKLKPWDVAATVYAFLGVRRPRGLDGRSLVAAEEDKKPYLHLWFAWRKLARTSTTW